MSYIGTRLPTLFGVGRLYSVHYFEYARNFSFDGERHDFWEFIYADSGSVRITQGEAAHVLERGQIAFHQPMEFHDVHATGRSAPNLIVASFACRSAAMKYFAGKILTIDAEEKLLLASLIREAAGCFSSPLDDPYLENMSLSSSVPPGALQLLRLYLEEFLIHIYRRYHAPAGVPAPDAVQTTMQANDRERQYVCIQEYLLGRLGQTLTIRQICHDNMISRSQLYKLYREKAGCGVMDAFVQMKIRAARRMIRESDLQFQQIAEALGYSSLAYFSRQFRAVCGKSPSEYATSVKAMADKREQ
ncbi:helix-turn-helix domain-containing protein [Lachnoclostridium sp. Marseille-P6806]|uniref:helix-turn-helix domain-containing protein n=1 Tax=Lachnoclostridium sp. Marseille-P6806 TaxID=2364793 RepID=UPI0010316067|nr:AraC family transcriptional regulator [Lachnoclostridium sp. Marseille-P6806]